MPEGQFEAVTKDASSALGKALQVLDALLAADGKASLAELSDRLGMPRQTVHRVVRQLEDEGLVRRSLAGDGFVAGPRLVGLGVEALAAAARTAPVRAILRALVDEVGETCNLGVLDRDEVVYVERVECDWPLRLQVSVGSRAPIHATAIGKLLFAHLPSRARKRILEAGRFERFTDNTIVDPAALADELAAVRRQGFAVNAEENTPGLMGFAVPVRDGKGRVVAAVSLHAPTARMSVDKARGLRERFLIAAADLGRAIADAEGASQ